METFYSYKKEWGNEDGFSFAVGIVTYDNSSATIEDPSIGTLKIYIKSWDSEDFEAGLFKKIDSHAC